MTPREVPITYLLTVRHKHLFLQLRTTLLPTTPEPSLTSSLCGSLPATLLSPLFSISDVGSLTSLGCLPLPYIPSDNFYSKYLYTPWDLS